MNRKIAATGIAKWLVHRYPKAWRERYASEMLALLDDSATRWRDLIDLMHGLLVERLHSVFEPGSRPKLTFALLFAAPMVIGLVPVLLAVGLGAAARSMFGAIPWWGVSAGGMLSLLTMLAWGFRRVIWQLRNPERAYVRPYGPVPAPPGWMVAMSLLGAMLLGAARTGPATLEALSGVVVAGEWLVMGGRWWRMNAAVQQLFAADREMKWAQMELDRCERLTPRGVPMPLEAARSEIRRIETQTEEALASLNSLGYRGRFSRDA
jgi:hypothetical protein